MAADASMERPSLKDPPRLPIEIILEIIKTLAPAIPGAVLPSTDDTTKTLLAFTRACRDTSSLASDMLARHCAYIDSSDKAKTLVKCLALPRAPRIEHMFLSPFSSPTANPTPSAVDGQAFDTLPTAVAELAVEESFETGSWSTDYGTAPLDDMPTCAAVRDILLEVAPTLRSLVIDMPLRSLYPDNDHDHVRPLLRQGFEALVNLEEFVSVRDELYLRTTLPDDPDREPEVWATCWPKVQRLAFYNLDLSFDMNAPWDKMARLPLLETIVLTRADFPNMSRFDFKEKWLNCVDGKDRSNRLNIVLVDCPQLQPVFPRSFRRIWAHLDPDNDVRILRADVHVPERCAGEDWELDWTSDCSPISLTQEFIRKHATHGTLWEEEAIGAQTVLFKPSKRGLIGL